MNKLNWNRPPDNLTPLLLDTVLAIATGEQTTFRNPVGLDAGPLLGWRGSLSDEESWIGSMAQLGAYVRPYRKAIA